MDRRAAQANAAVSRRFAAAVKLLGVCLLAFAFLLPALRLSGRWFCAVSVACGVFLLFLCRPLGHALVRRRAAEDYEAGRCETPAQTVRFCGDHIEVRTERYEAEIPYGMLYRAYENETVFLLYTGIGECRSVPKRIMNGEDRKRVENLLKDRMKQNFVQEGAREWTN